MDEVLVLMEGIDKSFPGVRALDIVSLNCGQGKCMRLLVKMAPGNRR